MNIVFSCLRSNMHEWIKFIKICYHFIVIAVFACVMIDHN